MIPGTYIVYVIIVFNFFHIQQAVLPGTFPDYNSCQAALVQKQISFGNWGECTAAGVAPSGKVYLKHKR